MTNSQRLATVRKALNRWLELNAENTAPATPGGESIVIRGGYYCGRRFSAPSHHAVWFVEEDELKVYTSDKRLACVLSSDDIDRWASSSSAQDDSVESVESVESNRQTGEPQRRAA